MAVVRGSNESLISLVTMLDNVHQQEMKSENYAKGKGEGHSRTGHEGSEGEWRYSSTLSLTPALDGVGEQRHAQAILQPGMTRHPFYGRLGRPQGRFGRLGKIWSGVQSPDRPPRGKSLYRLRHSGSQEL
jgi:hypothetical protein